MLYEPLRQKGVVGMYILKLFDEELLKFEVVENLADPVVKIAWKNEEKNHLMPLGMTATDDGLVKWIRHRAIPKNRAFVNAFLAKCGLNANRPMDVISVCKGLSLNDSYWVVDEEDKSTFEKANLYDNNFSQILARIAFTGYGSSIRSSFASSPEFTTNGMLPKCWRRIQKKVYLYKGGTSGASNTGNEPYSEKYASLIAENMGINAISYRISKWKGNVCSVCELFTSKDISYVPIGRIITTGGMRAVRKYYESLGDEFVAALNEMLVFDALVCNTDRHFGNFGVLVDSHTNEIIAPAPLFDHGNTLFSLAGEENWKSENLLDEYISTLLPCTYEDYIEEVKPYLDESLKKKIRGLLTFRFGNLGNYNYSSKKIKLIEAEIQKRANLLLH